MLRMHADNGAANIVDTHTYARPPVRMPARSLARTLTYLFCIFLYFYIMQPHNAPFYYFKVGFRYLN